MTGRQGRDCLGIVYIGMGGFEACPTDVSQAGNVWIVSKFLYVFLLSSFRKTYRSQLNIETTVKLRSWAQSDLASLVKYANNLNVAKNMTDKFPHPYTEQDAKEFIEYATADYPIHIFAIGPPVGPFPIDFAGVTKGSERQLRKGHHIHLNVTDPARNRIQKEREETTRPGSYMDRGRAKRAAALGTLQRVPRMASGSGGVNQNLCSV